MYKELKTKLKEYVQGDSIIELANMCNTLCKTSLAKMTTIIGKYSYEFICKNHQLMESIGDFCIGC